MGSQILMSAALRLQPVKWTRIAEILYSFFWLINKWESALCNTQIKLSCISNYEFGGNQLIINSSISTSSSVISVRKISFLLDSVTVFILLSISYLFWLKCYWCGFQILMNAALRPSPVTWTRSATILLAHTAVLAILGTLVTEQHARVQNLANAMLLGYLE